MEKYLHVSFMVKQQNLYDLLHALEAHKVGNVEVRPVSRILNGAAEEPARPRTALIPKLRKLKMKGGLTRTVGVRERVRGLLKLNEPVRYWELAQQNGLNPKSVVTSVRALQQEGIVRKVSTGVYMRIKEDA